VASLDVPAVRGYELTMKSTSFSKTGINPMDARTSSFVHPSTTFLLVHGAGTSSFMWGPLQRQLALDGYRSYAIDLPGHGLDAQYPLSYQAPQDLEALAAEVSTLAAVSLADNIEAVISVTRSLIRTGPVVIVGSSLGGITIGAAASRAPELFTRMVYISAWVCVERANPIEWMGEPEFARSMLPQLGGVAVGDPAVIGTGRANYRTADRVQLGLLHEATMAEATDAEFRAFLNIMQPDESLRVMMGEGSVDPGTWGTIPRTFIRLSQDRSIPLALQDRMIADADRVTPTNTFVVHTVASSHAGFIRQSPLVSSLLTGI
jgi:pimeloyl-ACP methyl ester carboxylesterase